MPPEQLHSLSWGNWVCDSRGRSKADFSFEAKTSDLQQNIGKKDATAPDSPIVVRGEDMD